MADVDAVYANWSANGYRLPTEAEWEKAARGGLSGQRFPWGDTISESQANYYGDHHRYSYDLGPNGYNASFDKRSVSLHESGGVILRRTGMGYTTWLGMCWSGVGIGMGRRMVNQPLLIQQDRQLELPCFARRLLDAPRQPRAVRLSLELQSV